MGYGAILTFACLILTIRFLFVTNASPRSKYIVAGIAVTSLLIPWQIMAVLAQLVDSLFVLLYLKASRRLR